MEFAEYPPGYLPPAEVGLMLGFAPRYIRDCCASKDGNEPIMKSKRYLVPGKPPLWLIDEKALIDFIEWKIPFEQKDISVIEKRIAKQTAVHKFLRNKYNV